MKNINSLKKRSVQTEIMLENFENWLKKFERRTICRREFFSTKEHRSIRTPYLKRTAAMGWKRGGREGGKGEREGGKNSISSVISGNAQAGGGS